MLILSTLFRVSCVAHNLQTERRKKSLGDHNLRKNFDMWHDMYACDIKKKTINLSIFNISTVQNIQKTWKHYSSSLIRWQMTQKLFIYLHLKINSLFCSLIYYVQGCLKYIIFLPDLICSRYSYLRIHFIIGDFPVLSLIYYTYFDYFVLSAYIFYGKTNVIVIHSTFPI